MKPNVLVTSYYDAKATQPALDRLSAAATVRRAPPGELAGPGAFATALRDVQIAIVSGETCDESLMQAASHLKVIACDGAGVDHVDLAAATRRGIVVLNAPVVHESNGDFVMGMIIAMIRRMLVADRGVRSGHWNNRSRYVSRDVCGSTLGLLGFGRVAQAVARRARGFGMPLIAYSPNANRVVARELEVRIVGFDELLASADILSIHVTLNESTRGLIAERELSKIKRGSYLVNSSRGAVVDEVALVKALQDGKLAGAALDVFSDEPPAANHPLLAMENVVLSPHVGSDTLGTFSRVFECIVDDLLLFLSNRRPLNVVNPDVLESRTLCR